jgi:F-type H+-transporting ATPase subunit delta
MNKIVAGIIKYLIDEKKTNVIPELIAELKKIKDVKREMAVLESAIALSGAQKQEMESLIREKFGRTGEIEYRITPELLGGIKITFGDQILDLSVKSKLNKLYEQT